MYSDIMNKIQILLIVGMWLNGFAIASAEALRGNVFASDIEIANNDENFFIKMNLELSDYKNMNSNREVIITPVLSNGSESLALPSVMVAGRNRYYHWLRENEKNRPTALLYRTGEHAKVSYSTSVKFEPWMEQCNLYFATATRGCCGAPVSEGSSLICNVNLAAPAFLPAYVFIQPEKELVKVRYLRGEAYIDFPVAQIQLYPDYRNNPKELGRINASIDSVKSDKDIAVRSLSIKGYASPEGSFAMNTRLAKGRTETLKDYVLRRYDFPESIVKTSFVAEDWDGLRKYVDNSNIENKEEILSIINSSMEPDMKDAAISKRFPEQYSFLLKNVYPSLRHSDYVVEYTIRQFTDIDEIKELLFTAPQKLSLSEIFAAASTFDKDSPEYKETFKIAVRMYPADEIANLNAGNIALQEGDLENASRYLDKAGNTPQAVYARGLLAAMEKDYETALNLCEKALAEGIEEAGSTIEGIRALMEYYDQK